MGKKDNNTENDDEMMVTLTLDDDSTIETVVVTIFEADGKDYIALLPTEGIDAEEGDIYLYRYKEAPDGNPDLTNIESDEEYDIASEAFSEWLDEQEYDEVVTEEE